jgi:hypothetical protein
MNVENTILVTGGVLTALHAGLLYDFSVDIVPALRSTKGTTHISMMQAINRKIENPVFFLSFWSMVLLPGRHLHWANHSSPALLAASIQIVPAGRDRDKYPLKQAGKDRCEPPRSRGPDQTEFRAELRMLPHSIHVPWLPLQQLRSFGVCLSK